MSASSKNTNSTYLNPPQFDLHFAQELNVALNAYGLSEIRLLNNKKGYPTEFLNCVVYPIFSIAQKMKLKHPAKDVALVRH